MKNNLRNSILNIKMSFICKFCDTKFKHLSSLKLHIDSASYCLVKQGKIQEKKNLNLTCSICSKTLSSKQRLVEHEKKCSLIYLCEFCNITFDTGNSLIVHKSKCIKKFESEINNLKIELAKSEDRIRENDLLITKFETQIEEKNSQIELYPAANIDMYLNYLRN